MEKAPHESDKARRAPPPPRLLPGRGDMLLPLLLLASGSAAHEVVATPALPAPRARSRLLVVYVAGRDGVSSSRVAHDLIAIVQQRYADDLHRWGYAYPGNSSGTPVWQRREVVTRTAAG